MILFHIGKLNFYAWGTMVNIGFLAGFLVAFLESKRKNIAFYDIAILSILIYISAILGSWAMNFWINGAFGGFMFIGGAIASFVVSVIYVKLKKQNMDFGQAADVVIIAAPFAMFFGRIGCFLTNDHIGSITNLPWGIQIYGQLRHPVILYLLINIVVLIIFLNWLKFRIKKTGLLFTIGGIYYSATRFFLDFFRCADLWGCDLRYYNLTVTQWLLIPIFLLFVFFLKKCYSGTVAERTFRDSSLV